MRIKEFFEPELINARFPCPMCGYPNSIFHLGCLGCGGMKISGVILTHIGVIKDYDFIYHPVELERIARRNHRYYKGNVIGDVSTSTKFFPSSTQNLEKTHKKNKK
ncbi:MAG: hypothetical protein MUC98_02125 [Desulfobacterota bacterium]|nr:hypothetical protein [Thermodesulfobacteriota bacterium]